MRIASHAWLVLTWVRLAGAGAFWSGTPDASGRLPEPKHFWYDIHEYRLNSKPHIRRILQHQQAQEGKLPQPGAGHNLATDLSSGPSESSKDVAPHPHEQRHGSSTEAAAAAIDALSREPIQRNAWQPPGSQKQEQRGAHDADVKDSCAERCQDSHGKRLAPDGWQPVTVSQILKRQRLANAAAQLPQQPQGSAQTCEEPQHEQSSLSCSRMEEGTTREADTLVQPSEQEACDGSGALLGDTLDPGPHMDSEESCEDVLAMWGEAGEPDQEFAWAEAPAGMQDGNTEVSSESASHAASTIGHRTWACQVRSQATLCFVAIDNSNTCVRWVDRHA